MTTQTSTTSVGPLATVEQRPGFATTVIVELRKLIDTRSAHYLGIATAALTLVFLGGGALTRAVNYADLAKLAAVPFGTIMLAVAALTAAGEYGNRSAGITFLAEPRRIRVLCGQAVALAVVTIVGVLVCYALSAIALPIIAQFTGSELDWTMSTAMWGVNTMVLRIGVGVIFVWQAYALGLLLLNAPAAIVIVLVQPMVFSMIVTAVPSAADLLRWVDPSTLPATLYQSTATATQWAQIGTGLTLWLVLPAVVGTIRVQRREVN